MRCVGICMLVVFCLFAAGCSFEMKSGDHPDNDPRKSSPVAEIFNFFAGAKVVPKEGIVVSQEHMRGTKQYEDVFGGKKNVYVDDDPEDLPYFKAALSSYFSDYTGHSIRYRDNLFCATINPEGHGIEGLGQAVDLWRFAHVSGGSMIAPQPISFERQKNPEYCWVGALQFIRKYQHGIYARQDDLFEMGKGGRQDTEAGSFFDIIRAYGENGSTWVVANHGETLLVRGVQFDLTPLLAMAGEGDSPGHIVLVLGVTFSFVTSGKGYLAANAAAMIPLSSTLIRPSHFVFHEFLIFDPNNAMVSEVRADDILPRVNFVALNIMSSKANPFRGEDVIDNDVKKKYGLK